MLHENYELIRVKIHSVENRISNLNLFERKNYKFHAFD